MLARNSAVEVEVNVLSEFKASAYDYFSKKKNEQVAGVALNFFGLYTDDEGVEKPIIININGVELSDKVVPGMYVLKCPASWVRSSLCGGMFVDTLGYTKGAERVSFTPLKK